MSIRSPWIARFIVFFLVSVLFSVMHTGTVSAAKENDTFKLSSRDQSRPSGFVGKVISEGMNVKNAKISYELHHYGDGAEQQSGSVVSDENGNYRIDVVLPNSKDYFTMDFTVEAEGYLLYNHRGSESLEADKVRTINFYIYEPSTIVGTVTDKEGKPVADALVSVTALYGKPVKTNQRGIYMVTGIDFEYPNIAIKVDSADYMIYEQDRLELWAGETIKWDVVLTEAAHVRGKVVDEAGNPVIGAKVNVGGSAITDAQGNYFIKRVSTTNRTLSAEATGYIKYNLSVDLVHGDRNSYDIVLISDTDRTPPVTKYRLVPITDTLNGKTYIKGFTFILQASDEVNGSGIKVTEYRINGGKWNNYEGPVKFYAPDVKLVEYFSTDVAGNQEKYNKMDFVKGTFEGAGSY
ncbi:carboxypeptidase-like regulatory domain-containing protein [Paenibacillus sp. Z3-2]